VQGLAGGEPSAGAAGAQVGGLAAGRFHGEQDPNQFGVVPALGPRGRHELGHVAADVGQLESPCQLDGLGQRIAARGRH
jgi:hypothetical protein